MDNYLVSMTFIVNMRGVDLTRGQTPPAAPGEIADLDPDMLLQHQFCDDLGNSTLNVETRVRAENDDGLIDDLTNRFNHLPGFEVLDSEVVLKGEKGMSFYKVRCHFKSSVPFATLKAGFAKHVAKGNLVSNGNVHGEYFAFVDVESLSHVDLDGVVHGLLAKAFDADTEESAINFKPIKTDVLF